MTDPTVDVVARVLHQRVRDTNRQLIAVVAAVRRRHDVSLRWLTKELDIAWPKLARFESGRWILDADDAEKLWRWCANPTFPDRD